MTWEIRQGDCLEVLRTLPDCSVDAVVTDPPYATVGESASTAEYGKSMAHVESQFYEAWLREQMKEWSRILRPTGAVWLTLDWRGAMCLDRVALRLDGFKKPKIGVWHREGLGMGYVLRNTYECFAVVPCAEFKRRKTDEPDVWVHKWTPSNRKSGHSAEKPISLMSRACALVVPPGGLVLDPFCGSGTTGVACVQAGFSFIGIEREPEYCETARARIAACEQEAAQ